MDHPADLEFGVRVFFSGMDWSYGLLSSDARVVVTELSFIFDS